MELRRLTAADAEAFREIRLYALRALPQAFSADYETNIERSLQYFAACRLFDLRECTASLEALYEQSVQSLRRQEHR